MIAFDTQPSKQNNATSQTKQNSNSELKYKLVYINIVGQVVAYVSLKPTYRHLQ